MSSPLNPTGFVPTQQQMDDSYRDNYWHNAVRTGSYYYIAGRFSVLARFMIVDANIFHHGAEMFMKAILSKADSVAQIKKYWTVYRHSLAKLWQEVKSRHPTIDFTSHDATVTSLDKFEELRYPEGLLTGGALIVVNIHDVPVLPSSNPLPVPRFELSLPAMDRLMALLFPLTNYNSDALRTHISGAGAHAITYFNLDNTAPMMALA
jgi:hypothetical protein